MLVTNALIAGGAIYAGIKTLITNRNKPVAWLGEPAGQIRAGSASATDVFSFPQIEGKTRRHFSVASVSLGLSLSGAFVYPPLALASVPLTVLASIPIFENAYEALFKEGRIRMAVVSSAAVIGTLATGHYLMAPLVDCIHYLAHLVALSWKREKSSLPGLASSREATDIEHLPSHVHVIRCWKESTGEDGEAVMRYTLEAPGAGKRRGFTSAAALLDALRVELTSDQASQTNINKAANVGILAMATQPA
jgi:hypothetical protein